LEDPLAETETLCKRVLAVLTGLENVQNEKIESVREELLKLLPRIAESKKKIMVRSPQGRGLTEEVLDSASELSKVVADLSRCGVDKEAVEIPNILARLKDSIERLEIYWKSFEYVTT